LHCYSITVHGNVTGVYVALEVDVRKTKALTCEDMETVTVIGKGRCA